jgi:hypothetical protein
LEDFNDSPLTNTALAFRGDLPSPIQVVLFSDSDGEAVYARLSGIPFPDAHCFPIATYVNTHIHTNSVYYLVFGCVHHFTLMNLNFSGRIFLHLKFHYITLL